MEYHDEQGVDDRERQIDEQLFAANYYPESVEITNCANTGSGFSAFSIVTPMHVLLEKERQSDPDQLSDREKEIIHEARRQSMELLLRELIGDGKRLDPVQAGLNLYMWAWDLQMYPFNAMTYEQIAALAGQGRAAVCERQKRKIQRKKEKAGMKGTRSSRQKPVSIVKRYSKSAQGNRNRRIATGRDKVAQVFGGRRRKEVPAQ